MHRIDSSTATPDNRFTEGDPTIPVAATTVTADWLNTVQEEPIAVLAAAGIAPNKADNGQLLKAINALIAENGIGAATLAALGIGRIASLEDALPESIINVGPAFLDAENFKVSPISFPYTIPRADASGRLDAWISPQAQYATSTTAATTAAKAVDCTNFALTTGARVFVSFANANTVAGALTLNVNNTGAKPIHDESGQAVSATTPAYFPAACLIEFAYNGANWVYHRAVCSRYKNGTEWWEIWTDGLIVQGGHVGTGAATGTLTLLKAYKDLTWGFYMGLMGGNGGYSSNGAMTGAGAVKTISSVTWNYTGSNSPSIGSGNFDWWARGY